jgi:glycosyltransferase involved in cell wall biosynthesis
MSFLPQRLLLNRADAIATVSNTTKELIAKHKLTIKPVSVIYNAPEADPELATGANGDFQAPRHRPAPENQERQSLVYMGSFMDYKNVEVLIRGMAELPGYELDLLSRISPSRQEQLKGLIPANARVNFHNGVSEQKYHELLTGAVALVSGSRDEGFGIPLVEAMSRGIPVVVSQIPIFKEIGGEAAIYFDQEDPRAFATAVLSIKSDSAWLQKSKASQQQAKKFTWANSAKSLLELLHQI